VKRARVLLAVVASIAALRAIGAVGAEARADRSVAADAVATPDRWPRIASPVARDPRIEARIAALLARMSVEAKVGQITQADIGSVTPDDVRRYRLGSVLAGGNSDPGGRIDATPADWLALADALHAASVDPAGDGPPIPILFGIDAVHGHNNVVGATLFPHNVGLGATRNAELVRRIGAATAAEMRATGIDWTFAPTVAVPRDARWGRTYEGFSSDPAIVASLGAALVEGLQGRVGTPGFLGPTQVLATAKHFIGDGGTTDGVDQGDTRVPEAVLRDVHGAGHFAALRAGVQSVMASFSSWNGVKLHGHRGLLTDVLKGRLGFDGFVVGDWNGHEQLPGCTADDCPRAIDAGVDMPMTPVAWRAFHANTVRRVRAGELPMARLDDAVARILRVKLRMGLLDAGPPSRRALGGRFELLGSAAHRAIAREAVRESLVLLANPRGVLPISPKSRVLVVGEAADNVGKQAGGWTLSWQGEAEAAGGSALFPNAQSIWQSLRERIERAGGQAIRAADAGIPPDARPDVAILVFGEAPYAEMKGDLATLAWAPAHDAERRMLDALKAAGIPTVAVFLTGRPRVVGAMLDAADAFVVAWLPGSEGGGVTDVLLRADDGRIAHDFRGRLPFAWPRTASQPPQHAGEPGYDPRFPVGFGLRYEDGPGSAGRARPGGPAARN
jgi:beta-glucosidase